MLIMVNLFALEFVLNGQENIAVQQCEQCARCSFQNRQDMLMTSIYQNVPFIQSIWKLSVNNP